MSQLTPPEVDSRTGKTEVEAAAACRRGDFRTSASLLLEAYGVELRTFLFARLSRNDSVAEEVFSDFLEDFWRGLPEFQWRCSARAWCYILLRHAATRFNRAPHNRPERRLPLSGPLPESELVQKLRTQTREYERTEVKDGFQQLRELLPNDDQELLILRVNRKLPWREVALVMLDSNADVDEEDLRLKAQALRRRLVEIVRRLRKMADDSGLIPATE
jgi:RNA polymerase sigma-70 factor, ECF subfamily